MQVSDVIFTLKEGIIYREDDGMATCGANLFTNHPIIGSEFEMKKIMTREVLEGIYGDVAQRLNKIDAMCGKDVVKARKELKKLIHDIRL